MIKSFNEFIFENSNIVNKYNTYLFDNKIKQDSTYAKQNALNIKEVIHKACDWVGDNSCFIFLFEIAIVETSLGCSSRSKATRGDIGRSLWHVDEGTFKDTLTSPKLEKYRANLKNHGLDWTKVEWNDLSLNILLGAIGAKLVLLLKGVDKNFSSKLHSLDNRSSYYSSHYNCGGTIEAKENYIKNTKAWYSVLMKQGAEYLEFNNIKYQITPNGLSLNNKLA